MNSGVVFQLRRALIASGSLEAGEKELQKVLASAPEGTRAGILIADSMLRRGRFNEASQLATAVLSRSPGVKEMYLLRSICWRAQRQYPEAENDLQAALRLDPNYVEAFMERSRLRIAQRNPNEAEAILRMAEKMNPGDRQVLALVAETMLMQDKGQEAVTLISSRLAANPSRDLHLLLASVALKTGQPDTAIAALNKSTESPNDFSVLMQLGAALERKGDFAGAAQRYRQARRADGKNPVAAAALGDMLVRTGSHDEALAEYMAAIELGSTAPSVHNNAAYFLAERNKELDRALVLAQSASKADPANGDFSDTVGLVMVKKGMIDSGLHVFRSLIQRHPTAHVYRRHLVEALLVKGDREGAKKEIADALQLRLAEGDAAVFMKLLAQIQ